MAANNEKDKEVKGSSAQADQEMESYHDDPLREESTDYRAPGETFETVAEGENLDLSRMDQPRTDLESVPKAHKEKESIHERKQQDKNLDMSRMGQDQPRTDLETLPKAHKEKESIHERKQQDAGPDADKKRVA